MINKEIALQYLSKGLSVIPLNSPGTIYGNYSQKEFNDRCKRPTITGWKEFQPHEVVGPKVTRQSAERWEERSLAAYRSNHRGKGPKYNKTEK